MFDDEVLTLEHEFVAEDIRELFYIAHINNLPSILQHGLLSHKRCQQLRAKDADISSQHVQDRRASHAVERIQADRERRLNDDNPPGFKRYRPLHRYVNLYINPHNAMMYVSKHKHEELCVLRIDRRILDRKDVVISNQNMATDGAEVVEVVDLKLPSEKSRWLTSSYSMHRYDPRPIKEAHKKTRQAETLVPKNISANFICGV